ncbi:hypothetical protein WR25_14295 isoform D [Diploscapter pachys]|uniref:NADP-dependent oxidoreductase domain-containing protein n=1 Tax=Diploscapter pachys TaxID=2018661 RepID=A0A2A2KH68_9BILA|nr:hypothetical protein WR25_14295 isoform D [Diploscapter pachys]
MDYTIKLNSGYEMPLVGMGSWLGKDEEVKFKNFQQMKLTEINIEMEKIMSDAFDAGYRHIDTAFLYGNQKGIGKGILKVITDGKILRDDIFVTTKIWNTSHTYARAKEAIYENLRQLGLDYIDLMLIHWPMAFKEGDDIFPLDSNGKVIEGEGHFFEAWKALEDSIEEGHVRSIGVSNFNHKQIERLLEKAKIRPAVNQVEMHPYYQQKKLRDYCKEKGIIVTAFSPLGSPGDTNFRNKQMPNILTDPVLAEIAKKHGKSPAQVALRWAVQNGVIVIPKSANPGKFENMSSLY